MKGSMHTSHVDGLPPVVGRTRGQESVTATDFAFSLLPPGLPRFLIAAAVTVSRAARSASDVARWLLPQAESLGRPQLVAMLLVGLEYLKHRGCMQTVAAPWAGCRCGLVLVNLLYSATLL